jgi:hypothetical protein
MQVLMREQFLQILQLTSGAFDQLQHSGHVALAFGTPLPSKPGWYLDLDLVAMAINLGLTPSLGRDASTVIVGAYFDQWASAVGHAEAELDRDFFFATGAEGWDAEKKRPDVLLVTHGTLDQIAQDFHGHRNLRGFFTVNVSDIIRRLRARAHAAGIDLGRPFFFPPNDPRFHQILVQVKRERDARIARFRRDKKKSALAKQRSRHQNTRPLPRVAEITYPITSF